MYQSRPPDETTFTHFLKKASELFDVAFNLFFNFYTGLIIGVVFALPFDWKFEDKEYVDKYLSEGCKKGFFHDYDADYCASSCISCNEVGGVMKRNGECIRSEIGDNIYNLKCKLKGRQLDQTGVCEPKE